MNFFDVKVEDGRVYFSDGNQITLFDGMVKKLAGRSGDMILGIRGEDIKMDAQNMDINDENRLHAVITDTEVMEMRTTCISALAGPRPSPGYPSTR